MFDFIEFGIRSLKFKVKALQPRITVIHYSLYLHPTQTKSILQSCIRRKFKNITFYINVFASDNRARNFRGRVSHFNQSEARKQCFLASDWLKYETLPRKFRTLY